MIQAIHKLVADEPDPAFKADYAKCLQAFLVAQKTKMQASAQPSYGGGQPQQQGTSGANTQTAGISQVLQALGGGH